ncbi:LysR family transcriptional regulator [Pradoshia sp.]
MELSWLQTFLTAAECGNFRKTAELLYISQPSVTVHIHHLEEELGVKLFDRERQRVKLTKEGRRFIIHAKRILDDCEKGMEDMQSFHQRYMAKLTIAISPLIADTILPYVLKKYMIKHPQMEVAVRVTDSVDIEQEVYKDQVDIGLSCLMPLHSELVCEELYTDQVALIARHDGMDSERALIPDEEEILKNNLLLTDNHPVYWEGLKKQIRLKYPRVKMMKVSQVHITKRFIIEGLGVSFLPASTVRREILEGSVMEVPCHILTNLPKAGTYAIMKDRDAKLIEFMEFLKTFRI